MVGHVEDSVLRQSRDCQFRKFVNINHKQNVNINIYFLSPYIFCIFPFLSLIFFFSHFIAFNHFQ